MYSSDSILILKNRIGFGNGSGVDVTIAPEHIIGLSGRTFGYFHKLVTIQNLYSTTDQIDMIESDFNNYLNQLKTDAVLASLTSVLNQNKMHQNSFDYSGVIISQPEVFDNVIGYTLAISAIEQMVSSSRLNEKQRNASLSYNQLKIELEGITDDSGRVLAKGLSSKLTVAIRKATDIIFPNPITINDATDMW